MPCSDVLVGEHARSLSASQHVVVVNMMLPRPSHYASCIRWRL